MTDVSAKTEKRTTLAGGLDELNLLYKGKVRNVYEYDAERLLIVASNRVSAFDVVFAEPVPHKGAVLNLLSAWWFARTKTIVANHLLTTNAAEILAGGGDPALRGQMALVKRADPIRFECVVRGHLDGSGWREYEQTGRLAGYELPAGLKRYDKLPEPLFTPARKNLEGHDENITVAQMAEEYGLAQTALLEKHSVALYEYAYNILAPRGILLLDTKFEFGKLPGGKIVVIDEIFTPDSSRYRLADGAGADGTDLRAFDKQFLRDWLAGQGFQGEGTPPALAPEVIEELSRRYRRVFELITGDAFEAGK